MEILREETQINKYVYMDKYISIPLYSSIFLLLVILKVNKYISGGNKKLNNIIGQFTVNCYC